MRGGRYYLGILVILFVAYLLSLDQCPIDFSSSSGEEEQIPTNQVEYAIGELFKRANLEKRHFLKRVAVGYNTNLDLACNGASILNKLGVDPHTLNNIAPTESISTLNDFANSFAHFFKQGSAAERAVTNSKLWDTILEPLESDNYHNCQLLPGGNAALISNQLAALDVSVLLGGPVGETLEPLIHKNIKTLQKFHEINSNEPFPTVSDEIHLIMEFKTGETWGPVTSPRANRFIISHDLQNSHLTAIEQFHEAVEQYNPQVVIIAGSHLLEALPQEERDSRMQSLVTALERIPSQIAVHLEVAGVGDNVFLEEIARRLFPLVDSIGLNEQELGMLYIATGGKELRVNNFVNPTVQASSSAIQYLFDLPYVKTGSGKHELNRVHLHYLSYHLIAQRKNPRSNFFAWKKENAARAVAAGSLATTTQACGKNGNLPDPSQLHINSYGVDELFSHFTTSSLEFWVAPVAVCIVPQRTVGLGDCISATGLAYHF